MRLDARRAGPRAVPRCTRDLVGRAGPPSDRRGSAAIGFGRSEMGNGKIRRRTMLKRGRLDGQRDYLRGSLRRIPSWYIDAHRLHGFVTASAATSQSGNLYNIGREGSTQNRPLMLVGYLDLAHSSLRRRSGIFDSSANALMTRGFEDTSAHKMLVVHSYLCLPAGNGEFSYAMGTQSAFGPSLSGDLV